MLAPDPTPPPPVFVDESGRRARWVVLFGRLVGGVCLIYVALVIASLLGAPWVPHEALPTVGPSLRANSPVTLPRTAGRQPAPSLVAPHTTTTQQATIRRPTTTIAPQGTSTTTVTAPGHSSRTTTTIVSPATTTTTPPGHSGTAPGRTTHG